MWQPPRADHTLTFTQSSQGPPFGRRAPPGPRYSVGRHGSTWHWMATRAPLQPLWLTRDYTGTMSTLLPLWNGRSGSQSAGIHSASLVWAFDSQWNVSHWEQIHDLLWGLSSIIQRLHKLHLERDKKTFDSDVLYCSRPNRPVNSFLEFLYYYIMS